MKLLPVVLLIFTSAASLAAQTFKLVRSQSGPSGIVDGSKLVLNETRSRFVYPQDKTLVVYFEWVGPAGGHTLTAHWKAPDGRVHEISADVRMRTQTPEFGAYWQYTLREGLPSGVWTLEVRIDGEPAGSHSFEVISPEPAQPAAVKEAPARLTVEQIYSRARPSLVWVHKIDKQGRRFDTSTGFVWAKDRIATAFQSVDSAVKLEIEFEDGRREQSEELAGLSRTQDWALVSAPTLEAKAVERGSPANLKIGERALVFNVEGRNGRSIGGVDITAKREDRVFGPRVAFSPSVGPEVAGGPLLTSSGSAAAVLGGSRTPGGRPATIGSARWENSVLGWNNESTPIGLIVEQAPRTLADLLTTGELTPPVNQVPELLIGGTTREYPNTSTAQLPIETAEFSRMDREIIIYSAWHKKGKRGKGVLGGAVYDVDNHKVVVFTPRKISFGSEMSARILSSFSPASLRAAPYRIDLVFDGEVCWRGYVRIVD